MTSVPVTHLRPCPAAQASPAETPIWRILAIGAAIGFGAGAIGELILRAAA